MRASDFLPEKINPEVVEPDFYAETNVDLPGVGPLKFVAKNIKPRPYTPQFLVKVFRPDGQSIAYFRFLVMDYEEPTGFRFLSKFKKFKDPYVIGANVSVWNEFQRKGIARAVYQWIKSMGNDLRPSPTQTDAGRSMWRGFEKAPLEERKKRRKKSRWAFSGPGGWYGYYYGGSGESEAGGDGGGESVAEDLEQKFLWHGSRQKIPVLEPRQSVDTGGAAGSNQNAIYATSDLKVAIAMGLTTPGSDTGMFPNDPQMVLFSGKIRKGENVYLHKLPFDGPDGKPQFVQGGNSREFHSIPNVTEIKPLEIKAVPVNKYLNLIRQATPRDLELRKQYLKQGVEENFADGKVKGKSRPGRVKRSGASCSGSVTDLRARAKKYGGERGKMYHWCANMKGGRRK
jgi:hypothetical protein